MDVTVLRFINETMANSVFDSFFPWWTDIQRTSTFQFFLLPLILISVFWFWRWRGIVVVICGALLTWGADLTCSRLIKSLFNRARPFEVLSDIVVRVPKPGSTSFPSGHTLDAFFLATFLTLIHPRLAWLYYPLACLTAFSRVYLGVHYPTDVLGGAFFGCLLAYCVVTLYRFAITKEKPV